MPSPRELFGHWIYRPAEASRDLRLDFLRGYLIFVMTIDHLRLTQSWLKYFTGVGILWVSAAEGFVLISGMVFGLIYQQRVRTRGWEVVIRKVIKRAGQLYLVAVIWQLAFGSLDYLQRAYLHRTTNLPENYWEFIENAFFHVRELILGVDLLPLYSVLLLWALLVLYLLERGQWPAVIAASLLLWHASRLAPNAFRIFELNFNPFMWQILFTAGLLFGYYRAEIRQFRARLPLPRGLFSTLLISSTFFLLGLSFQVMLNDWFPQIGWLSSRGDIFGKMYLSPGRVMASIWVFWGFYELVTLTWKPLNQIFGWLLTFLGQHALEAYVIQASLVYLILSLPGHPFAQTTSKTWFPILQLAIFLLVWVLTQGLLRLNRRIAAKLKTSPAQTKI